MALHGSLHLSYEICLTKLLGTHVDRQHKVTGERILLPCLELGTSRFNNPLPNLQDQSHFLCQRNEFQGRD